MISIRPSSPPKSTARLPLVSLSPFLCGQLPHGPYPKGQCIHVLFFIIHSPAVPGGPSGRRLSMLVPGKVNVDLNSLLHQATP